MREIPLTDTHKVIRTIASAETTLQCIAWLLLENARAPCRATHRPLLQSRRVAAVGWISFAIDLRPRRRSSGDDRVHWLLIGLTRLQTVRVSGADVR